MTYPPYWSQPALIGFPFFLAGILLAFRVSIPPIILFLIMGISSSALVWGFFQRSPKKRTAGLVLFFLALGLLRSDVSFRYRPDSHIAYCTGQSVQCTGIASGEAISRSGFFQIPIRAISLHNGSGRFSATGSLLLRTRDIRAAKVDPGDSISFTGRLQKPRSGNPGDFNYRIYLQSRGIDLIASTQDLEIRPCRGFHLKRFILQVRNKTSRIFAQAMPDNDRNRSIALATLLGLQIELDEETQEAFRDSGLLHVLAVSGFHTALIAALAYFILSLFCRRRSWVVAGSIVILWFYILLTGMPSSAERAGWMSTAFLVSLLFERSHAPMNALALSGIGLTLVRPALLFDAGFQLSFAATLGILLWIQVRNRVLPAKAPGFISKPVDAVALSVSASLFTLPILLHSFGQTAAFGFLASIPAGTLSGVILVLDLSIVFANFIHPVLAHFYANVNDLAINALCWIADIFSRPSWNRISFHMPSGAAVFYYLFLLGLFHSAQSWGKRALIWSVAAAIAFGGLSRYKPATFRATFFDVGNGDAILLQFPRNVNIMVDTGPCLFGGKGRHESRLAETLHRMGVSRLKAVILTHFDSDHACGLFSLLEKANVDRVFGPAYSDGGGHEADLRNRISASGVALQPLKAGDRIEGLPSGFSLSVLHPCTPFATRNDNSLAILLTARGRCFLLAGDVEGPSAVAALASASPASFDLLKAPHHGEAGPAVLSWVKRRKPEAIIISNRVAAREKPLMSLKDLRVFSTSQGGAIIAELKPEGLRITGPDRFHFRKNLWGP